MKFKSTLRESPVQQFWNSKRNYTVALQTRPLRCLHINLSLLCASNYTLKTIFFHEQVWSLGSDTIQCIQLHDVKDQIHNLVVSKTVACFIPHGAGIRVSHQIDKYLMKTTKFHFLHFIQQKVVMSLTRANIGQVYSWGGESKLLNSSKHVKCLNLVGGKLFCGCHDSSIQVLFFLQSFHEVFCFLCQCS